LLPLWGLVSILVSLPSSAGLMDRVERGGWWALVLKILVPLVAFILGLRIVGKAYQLFAMCG
jgi:hypothetical protein